MRGSFKVELLDQQHDGKYTFFFTHDIDVPSDHVDRVTEGGVNPKGWGVHRLMSHDCILNSNYLKNESLFFMISYQPIMVFYRKIMHQ